MLDGNARGVPSGAKPAAMNTPWRVGEDVPWTVSWSGESAFDLQPSTDFPGFLDLMQIESPGVGVPRFGAMNISRHRRAMVQHLCHVCGRPTLKKDRYLFPAHSGGMVTMQNGSQRYGGNVPGVHLACARTAAQRCPHLSGHYGRPVPFPKDEGRLVQRTDVLPGLESLAAQLPKRSDIVFGCYRLFGEAFSHKVRSMVSARPD